MSWWDGKAVLVTGGTGSFGNAFAIEILKEPIRKLVIFSRDEHKQEEMAQRLTDERMRFLLGDVRDADALHHALRGIDVVIHAAALKRVPAIEYAPMEGLKTNVLGAANVITAAIDNHVETVMALSTDKAAAAHNLYGKTKALAEGLFIGANSLAGGQRPTFSVVRYGNVAGSRGSLVPKLLEQRASGIVTLTDERMTRFWITLDQAIAFIKARIEQETRAICVPVLPSVRVVDVIQAVVPEAKVVTVGIRAGEKLHETLITFEESPSAEDRFDFGYYEMRPRPAGVDGREFTYRSDTNTWWLGPDDIKKSLQTSLQAAA